MDRSFDLEGGDIPAKGTCAANTLTYKFVALNELLLHYVTSFARLRTSRFHVDKMIQMLVIDDLVAHEMCAPTMRDATYRSA